MDRLRRHAYEFGAFRLDPEDHLLLRENQPVALTPKSFDLLVALVQNSGRLVRKDELMERIWPDSFVEEANLSVKMSELRRALGEGPNEQRYIETVPRKGYRFVAEVKETNRDALDGGDLRSKEMAAPQKTSPTDQGLSQQLQGPRNSRYRSLIPIAAVILLAAAAVGMNTFGLRDRLLGTGEPVKIRSVAVLPLKIESADASQDYFAAGITDILISDLARTTSLRVISMPAVMQYKDTQQTLTEIGRELRVDALVTGALARNGEKVRMSLELVEAATRKSLWAKSYEGDLRNVLSLQSQAARDITSQIKLTSTPRGQEQLKNAGAVNPDAFDEYLRGRFHLYTHSEEENAAAIMALENAVRIDPDFAAAHAELAQAYVWKQFLFTPKDKRLSERAYVEAQKALSLDPDLAVGYLARGRALWTVDNNFPHEQVIRQYRRALEIDPNLDEARNQLALVYNHIGALDEALQEVQRAVQTNPSNSQAQFRIGETLMFQGKYDEAVASFRSVPNDANPALLGDQIVWSLWNSGKTQEAETELRQFLARFPDDNKGLMTSIEAVMAAARGDNDETERKIKIAIEKGKGFGHFHHTAFQIACAYARMNKLDKAMQFLELAANEGFPCFPLFENDPNLENLRQEPRFQALVERMRQQLSQYRSEW